MIVHTTKTLAIPKDKGISSYADSGYYEEFEKMVCCSFLRRGDAVIDIGANIGQLSVVFSDAVGPEGVVFAFEPSSCNFDYLRLNCQTNNAANVKCLKLAVGNAKGTSKLYLNAGNVGDHRLTLFGDSTGEEEVEVNTLDNMFVGSDRISKVELIKLDVQGWETEVIKGGLKLIKAQENLGMLVEVWEEGLQAAGSSASELLDLILDLGFELFVFGWIDFARLGNRTASMSPVNKEICLQAVKQGDFCNIWCVKTVKV